MGKKILIITAATAVVALGAVGVLYNTKQAKTARFFKKTGRAMYTVGTMLRNLSCQAMEA